MSMFKKFGLTAVAAGIAAGSMVVSNDAEAVPAFARQTGMACTSCHSGNFPALNAFGRSFKASNYTMRGAAPLVEGEKLSIPADLKMSLITKLRYQLDGSVDGGRGEIQWPDEAAFLVGGRAAENIGFLLEAGLGGGAGAASVGDLDGDGTANTAADQALWTPAAGMEVETEGAFLGFKAGFNVTDHFGVVVFGTDALGVGYGSEMMNTGFKRSQRPIENRSGYSAWQRLGIGSGAATGVALAYHSNNIAVSYSHWAPTWGNVNANVLGGLAHNLRANYFMNVAGWDMGFGVDFMSGTVKHGANDPVAPATTPEVRVAASGVDFQALGDLGGMPTEFYFSYAVAPEDAANGGQVYNDGAKDHTAFGLAGKFNVVKDTFAYLAYATDDNGTTTTADTTVGVQYMLAQNSKLELFNVSSDKTAASADYTMLMLFSGF